MGKTALVDDDGKTLDEGDPKGAPVSAKAKPDKRLEDENGKLLSEGDPKGPPVKAKKRSPLYDKSYNKDDE